MNGGTCIAAAIQKAGQLLKLADKVPTVVPEEGGNVYDGEEGETASGMLHLSAVDEDKSLPGARVLVLLTDGRVDSYQVCTEFWNYASNVYFMVPIGSALKHSVTFIYLKVTIGVEILSLLFLSALKTAECHVGWNWRHVLIRKKMRDFSYRRSSNRDACMQSLLLYKSRVTCRQASHHLIIING